MNPKSNITAAIRRLADAQREQAAALADLAASFEAVDSSAGDYVDQTSSPLGRRAHLAAVREGRLPGRKVGKKVLVTVEAMRAYVEAHPARKVEPSAPANDIDADLDALMARRGRRAR